MDTSSLLREAIAAFKAGQRQYARELLLEVIELEPANELAWIWLSGLLESREEQIKALENSLAIGKGGPGLNARLQIIGQRDISAESVKIRTAVAAVEAGDHGRGKRLLQEIIEENVDHERAWLVLSDILDDDEQRVSALENVLRINPNNIKAREKLNTIQHKLYQTFLSRGHYYQKQGESRKAMEAYQAAEKHASTGSFRAAARQRWQLIQKRSNIRPVKVANPTTRFVRLAAGPPVLFALLLLIQSGFDLSLIPIGSYISTFVLLLGSLVTAATYVPQHPLWSTLGMPNGLTPRSRIILLRTVGIIIILIPFILWILDGLRRLGENWGGF